MLALVLEQRGPDGAVVREVARPEPGTGEVLVRMLAASVNRVDLYMRDNGAGITHELPQVMGVDGVGEVVAAGAETQLAPGRRVVVYPYEFCGRCRYCLAGEHPLCVKAKIPGEHRDGTMAEYLVMPETSLLPISDKADVNGAAALGVAYLTAWRMLFGKVPLTPGAVVLVQGAGGGVSYAAAQLARMAGVRVILTTTGAQKLDHFRKAGFEMIDYREGDVAKAVLAMTGGQGADLVVDNVGEATWGQSLRSLCRGGSLVTCGATTGSQPGADLQRLFIRQLSVHGSTMGSFEEFRRLIASFEAGHFEVPIDSVYPLQQAAEALNRLSAPDRLGKVIVRIADPSASQGAGA
ncbi:zinc-binding dehydrogenase [Roseibium aggregatum]|uniref:Alcohol dehydrogenase catalytic domain-containing protein n=1 Tax=Roseibium aggregatum TaxID=187304 RepID=A0A926SAD1_9HYPH|nr:alcohol dehydrogenase catalytic domain-containing protein [Roseibium aggregatum]MBD1548799.1 alcohol dehydrogenase catalytic domain-containing protein [Roseibium aggregatum]